MEQVKRQRTEQKVKLEFRNEVNEAGCATVGIKREAENGEAK